jgi:anti-sigma28 factor (negative regulator of flagellin synthesis)
MSNERVSRNSKLSPEGERISGLVNRARQERIAQIREMLAAGTYHVSSTDLARKIIEANRR